MGWEALGTLLAAAGLWGDLVRRLTRIEDRQKSLERRLDVLEGLLLAPSGPEFEWPVKILQHGHGVQPDVRSGA